MNNRKVIVITGSSKGVGRYLAEHYVRQGFFVIGCSRHESDYKHELYQHYCVDVSYSKQVQSMFASIRKTHKKVDVLINNAAVNPFIFPYILIPEKLIQEIYGVNVFGVMNTCREAIKLMLGKKYGRIINIGSMAAKHEVEGESLYTSTKAAVVSFSRVLAKEINSYGITCNVLAPAAIPTELSAQVNQEKLSEVLSRNAIPNYGAFSDVSNAIDWLIKEESYAITGQVIYLGGV